MFANKSTCRVVSESLALAQHGRTLETDPGDGTSCSRKRSFCSNTSTAVSPRWSRVASALLPIAQGQRQVAIVTGARDAIDATQAKPSMAQHRRALDKVLGRSTSFALAHPPRASSRVGVDEVAVRARVVRQRVVAA
jgi:hypothetical protein